MPALSKKHDVQRRFKADIASHQIHVRHDEGVYRHVVFSRPESSCYLFSLTTTPGRLTYGGDMGTFVFERLTDMFEFFRRDHCERGPNFDYWHEKLVAVDRNGGADERSIDRFRENLNSYLEDTDLSKAQRREVKQFIDEACEEFEDRGPHAAYMSVHDFSLSDSGNRHQFFTDFFEYSDTVYSIHYEWACYAIQWGIARYDEWKDDAEGRSAAAKRLIPDDWFGDQK